MTKNTAAFAFIALAFTATQARAQGSETGTITGKVSDKTGARAPGVAITLTGSPAITKATTTDPQGMYTFASLPPGRYALSFELAGFRRLTRSGVSVTAAGVETVDATLELGAFNSAIEIARATPLVDVTQATLTTSIDNNALQRLPVGRDAFTVLQTLAPQVVFDHEDVGGSQSGEFHVFSANGSSWRQNTFAFNGINVSDPVATGAATYDFDSLEQIQVSTAQHSAEVETPGVYVNLVTKRGGDRLEGGASYYFQNESLQADNITPSQRERGIVGASSIKLFSDANIHLGGPLGTDKLRFFTSVRDWQVHKNVLDFPTTEDTNIRSGLGSLSYQIDSAKRVDLLATVQTYYKPHRGAAVQVSPDSTWVEDDVFKIFQGGYSSQIHGNALLDVRLSYSNIDFPLEFQPGVTSQFRSDSTGGWTGVANFAYKNFRSRLIGKATLSLQEAHWAGAAHALKLGYEFGHQASDSEIDARDGVSLYSTNDVPSFLFAFNTPVQTRSHFTHNTGFVQDNFALGRLHLSLGLRLQHTTGYLPAHVSPAGPFVGALSFSRQDVISWTNLAPRAGLVYDVGADHMTALKLGYGRYYHQLNPEPIEAVQNDLAFAFYTWNDLNHDLQFQPGELGENAATFSGVSITSIDPNVKRPYTEELTAGIERQLPGETKLTLEGVWRRSRNLLVTEEIGIPQDDSGYTRTSVRLPGPDGIPGTADDQTVTAFDLRPEFAGKQRRLVTNRSDFTTGFKGLVLILQKRFARRWQALLSYALSKDSLSRAALAYGPFFGGEEEAAGQSAFLNPNDAINNDGGPSFFDRRHNLKASASYEIPKLGVALAGILKIQSGVPYARIISTFDDAFGDPFNQGQVTLYAEPRDAHRLEALKLVDFRLSKSFKLAKSQRVELIADVFNLLNTSAATSLNGNNGRAFNDPLDIVGPRAVRFGARWGF